MTVAFGLWLRGKHELKVSREIGDGWLTVGTKRNPVFVLKSEIASYCNEVFWQWFWVWHRFRLGMGFPFPGGWADQPQSVVDVIELFETLRRNWEAERGA